MVKITILDPIESIISKADAQRILPCMQFKTEYWREGQFSKTREEYYKKLFNQTRANGYTFFTGFVPRIEKYCEDKGMEVSVVHKYDLRVKTKPPVVKDIILRKDQKRLIIKTRQKQRGIILSPTGSGKTIIQLGVMSAFPNSRILLLVHTISIVQQTVDELKLRGLSQDVQMMGGGRKGKLSSRIVVSTIQTFSKLNPDEFVDYFDMVIVDEVHRVSSFTGSYHKVLTNLLAPVRLGFTATLPDKEESRLAMEGLLGPVIGELSINKAAKLGILAKPKIKLFKTKYSSEIRQLTRYADVYEKGIVKNKQRNNKIAKIANELCRNKSTFLIFVSKIEHGNTLLQLCKNRGTDVEFVQGSTPPEERERIKKGLNDGTVVGAIATVVWGEGVDIPSLKAIINAAGGKAELGVLQKLGRGLRTTSDKKTVIIYDFFDPSHRYLIEHFGHRISLYMKHNWL